MNETIKNNWSVTQLTQATYQPVSLRQVHQHLRLFTEYGQHPDDDLIELYISAATGAAEDYLQRYLAQRTLRLKRDDFPTENQDGVTIITLPVYPVLSVDSINYVDLAGATQTLTGYEVDSDSIPARIRVLEPPDVKEGLSGLTINVTVGYASGDSPATADLIPAQIKQAILLMVGQMYEHRENVVVGTIATELPKTFEYLLHPHRVIGV
jgi:uncharacterized phiE125 gp8 family phage protein